MSVFLPFGLPTREWRLVGYQKFKAINYYVFMPVISKQVIPLINSGCKMRTMPGVYIAAFVQGNDKVTVRLIKEGK
jgi:hypothetical protein